MRLVNKVINRLSERGKRIVFNGIIVFAIMLFIIGFMLGKQEESNSANEEETHSETSYDGFSYTELQGSENDNIQNDSHEAENNEPMDDYEMEDPESDFDKNVEREVRVLEDYFTNEEVEEAKEVAIQFVENYYSFNGEIPLENIENAMEYVSEDLQETIKAKVIRPTADYYKRETISIEVYEPYNPSSEDMELSVRVKGEVFNMEGDVTKEETIDYHLKLIPFEDTFRVNEMSYDNLS